MKSSLRALGRRVVDRFPGTLGRLVAMRDRWRIQSMARRLPPRPLVVDAPFHLLNVELTNRCPFRCVMCPRTHHMTRAEGLMEFGLFKKIIDEYVEACPGVAAREETYLHHFGESLVHPEAAKFMRYAVEKGVRACMSINPLMLNAQNSRELLEAKPYKLLVSLDGHDDETFLQIRGVKNAYEKSRANLLDFLKLKAELKSKTLVVLSMIDFKLNHESIERLKGYWSGVAGLDEFHVKPFTTWNGDAEDVVALWDEKKQDNAELRKKVPFVVCNKPWGEMSVTFDGDIVACCFDYDKKVPLGSVKEKSLKELWNGEKMQALRKEFVDNHVVNPLCRDCAYLYSGFQYS